MARALMLCGTGSHAGKSLLTAAVCRILHRRGVSVAPFKAQNMSNNAAVADGGEIGRAQALQAQAAGLAPSVIMNPILLKPVGEMRSQVVELGQVVGTMDVHECRDYKLARGRDAVRRAYAELAAQHHIVVIEGAGSPAEVNLKSHDVANMWMAEAADARVLLVGDIDRGGVLASLAGTLELLEPHETARIAGFVINKFRGDVSLLTPGLEMLRDRYHKPTFGVIPWLEHTLPEEDGLGVPAHGHPFGPRRVNVAVLRFPRMANFTDFDPLGVEPDLALRYVDRPGDLDGADLVILPGSKATLSDLAWMRARGLDAAVSDHARAGGALLGVCGGYQMLGTRVADPHGVEGGGEADGLGLLPVTTVMNRRKRCALAAFTPAPGAGLGTEPVSGYEIHMGETRAQGGAALFADAPPGTGIRHGRVWGAYLHGLLDNDAARRALLAELRAQRGLPEPPPVSFRDTVNRSLDALADGVEKHLDMEAILALP